MTLRRIVLSTFALFALVNTVSAQSLYLPTRETPIPETTNGVPHVQLGVEPNPELSEKLLERVAQFPGVNIGPTRVSLPGAFGFQLEEGMSLARPDVIVGGGSLRIFTRTEVCMRRWSQIWQGRRFRQVGPLRIPGLISVKVGRDLL